MSILELFPDLGRIIADRTLPAGCAKPAVMVAMTPRTGSTHFCASLNAAAGMHDTDDEILNPRGGVQKLKQVLNVETFADYIQALGQQPGPYLIFKTTWDDFSLFSKLYRQMFPDLRLIYLHRLDTVEQAVSLFRAMKTQHWHQTHQPGQERAAPRVDGEVRAHFDARSIMEQIKSIERECEAWGDFFTAERLEPLCVTYERLSKDIGETIEFVAGELRMKLDRRIEPAIRYVKLADEINKEWAAKIRSYPPRQV